MKENDITDCEILRFGSAAAVKKVLDKFELDAPLRKFLREKYKVRLSADDCNDIRQESKAGLWAYVSSGRFRGDCSLKTLFWRIAARKCVDLLRRNRRFVSLPEDFGQTQIEPDLPAWISRERADALRRVFAAWHKISPGICPELLRLWSEKDGPFKEIEAFLGLKEGQGRQKTYDCMKHLQKWLQQNPVYLEQLR